MVASVISDAIEFDKSDHRVLKATCHIGNVLAAVFSITNVFGFHCFFALEIRKFCVRLIFGTVKSNDLQLSRAWEKRA